MDLIELIEDELDELENYYTQRIPRPRVFNVQINYFSDLDEQDFFSRFRLSKSAANRVHSLIKNKIKTKTPSFIGAVLHLLKACLGTGILAMPAAFKHSGLLVGAIGVFFTGVICTHTVHILVKTAQDICRIARVPSLSFAETCGAAFTFGPGNLHKCARTVRHTVDIGMIICYVSVLFVYVIFIATSIKQVVDFYHPDKVLSIQIYCLALLLPLIVICQIRSLKFLVPFSFLANVGVVVVFIITLYYIFDGLPPLKSRVLVAPLYEWPLFFSTVVFAMEGIGVVMPVENEMRRPDKFLGCPGVLNISMGVVILLFGVVGFFGYIQYGSAVMGSVTLNLPRDEKLAQSTKVLMAVVIFFTYTIQFYVPMEAISRKLKRKVKPSHENIAQIGIRTAIVTFTVAVAAIFPNLELMVSLVGAIFFSSFGILVPAIIQTVFRWERGLGPCKYILFKNIFVGLVALCALVSGTYTSVEKMVEEFKLADDIEEEE